MGMKEKYYIPTKFIGNVLNKNDTSTVFCLTSFGYLYMLFIIFMSKNIRQCY